MLVYIVVMNSDHLCRGFIDPEHVLFYATKYAGDDEWEELYCYQVGVDTTPRETT